MNDDSLLVVWRLDTPTQHHTTRWRNTPEVVYLSLGPEEAIRLAHALYKFRRHGINVVEPVSVCFKVKLL